MNRMLGMIVTLTAIQLTALVAISAEGPDEIIARAKKLNTSDPGTALKNLQDAVDLYSKQTTEQPENAEAWYALSCVTFELGRDDLSAFDAIGTAIILGPKTAKYHAQHGLMLLQVKKGKEAERAYEKAIELDPALMETRLAFSQALSTLGKKNEAAEVLEAAHKVNPLDATVMARLAIFKIDAGDTPQAIALLKKAIQAKPQDMETLDGIGQLLQETGQTEEAHNVYVTLAKKDPLSIRYESRLIQLCQTLSQIEERDRHLKRVYELNKQEKAEQKWFCREQFKVKDYRVMAVEFFEPQGQWHMKLQFAITKKDAPEKQDDRITLESPDHTTEFARNMFTKNGKEIDKDDRSWAIEVRRGKSRVNAGLSFGKQPSYEAVRARVVQVLEKAVENE